MLQFFTLAVICLCTASSNGSYFSRKVLSATTVQEDKPHIVYLQNLWILKNWTSFYDTHLQTKEFSSTVGDHSLKFRFHWILSTSHSIHCRVEHLKESDYLHIWWKILVEFLYSDGTTSYHSKTNNFDRDVMPSTNRERYIELYMGSLTDLLKVIPKSQYDLPIFFQIWYRSSITSTQKPSLEYIKSNVIDYQTYTDFGSKVLKDEKTADILVVTAQGNRRLHSTVISTRAPELYNELIAKSHEDSECQKPLKVDLNDVKLNIFDHVINFMYTDEIPILKSNDEWKDLLLMSKHFKMLSLEEICIGKLANEVNPNNIMKWYEFAKCNNVSKLENYVLEYWRINGLTMSSDKWDNILTNYTNFKCK